MSPAQVAFCLNARWLMADFYADPENERKFQEWKEQRKGRGNADGNSSHAPLGTAGIHDNTGRANHTASPTLCSA